MYCSKCGSKVNVEGKFCQTCGEAVQNGIDEQSQVLNQQINQPYSTHQEFSNANQNIQNNSYKNQGNTDFNPSETQTLLKKKKRNPLIIVGIIVVVIIFATCISLFLKGILNNLDKKNELVLYDLKVEYPISWMSESNNESNTKSITKGNARIVFNYTKSNVYYSSYSAANEFISEYEKIGVTFDKAAGIQDVTISGIQWKKIEFYGSIDGEDKKVIQVVHSTDYEIYSITYLSEKKDYDKYLDQANKIIESVYLPSKETNAQTVKQQILGEWDCGKTGYLVINSDDTYYFYKDSSKSMENVFYGTYEATDGIPTNAEGYVEGITFITTVKKFTSGGKDEPSYVDGKIQYAFLPDGTDNFQGSNLNTGASCTMTKVK